jgi:lipocalin
MDPNPLYSNIELWIQNSLSPTSVPIPIITVDELIIEQYLGVWFQMYSDKLVTDTIEENGLCITATYGLNNDSTISVRNYQTKYQPNGTSEIVNGYAYTPVKSEPGQLRVIFENVSNDKISFLGDNFTYWILELGPVVNGLYDYAIVTDSSGLTLYVLARDVTAFNLKYDREVKLSLVQYGYIVGLKEPISTYQGRDCVYEYDYSNDDNQETSDSNNTRKFSAADITALFLGLAAVAVIIGGGIFYMKRKTRVRKQDTLMSNI